MRVAKNCWRKPKYSHNPCTSLWDGCVWHDSNPELSHIRIMNYLEYFSLFVFIDEEIRMMGFDHPVGTGLLWNSTQKHILNIFSFCLSNSNVKAQHWSPLNLACQLHFYWPSVTSKAFPPQMPRQVACPEIPLPCWLTDFELILSADMRVSTHAWKWTLNILRLKWISASYSPARALTLNQAGEGSSENI